MKPSRDSPRWPPPTRVHASPPWKYGSAPAPTRALQQHEESIRAILKTTGIASGDAATAETATAIVSLCIQAGIDLRDALADDQ